MFTTPHTAIQIFNAAPDAVIVIDDKGTIVNWNPMAEKMFGWSREEAIGKLLAETIIPDRYRLAHQNGLERFLATGEGNVINTTVEVHARDIHDREFDVSLRISKSEWNDRIFFIGFLRDISDQKRAEHTTQYNSMLLQHVSDAVISTDKDMIIKSWNDAAEKVYGYSSAEIMGRNISTLGLNLSEEDINKHKISLRQEGYYKDEYVVRNKKGEEITILASVNVIRSGGKVTGYVAVQRDITLRKKMESQLRIFNKDLSRLVELKTAEIKSIFERVSDAFLALDTSWHYTYANKQLGDMVQKDPVQLIGKNIWEVFPEAIGSITYDTFHKAMKEQKYMTSTDYFAPLDLWQENHVYPSPNGLSVFIRDVTEKKKAEEKLKHNEEKYRSLIEQAADAIALFDKDNKILHVNKSATQLLGYSYAELITFSLRDVLSAVELQHDPVNFELLEKGESTIKPRKMIRKDGRVIETEVHAKRLPDGTFLALIRDLTERKKAESEIKQSYEAIRELVSYLQDIREEERLKIAQEIHDELGQQLTIMKMDVSWLDKKLPVNDLQVKEKTQALKNTLDATVKTVRRIASELRPSVLDDMGLAVAIEWHSREIEKRTGIMINLNLNMDQPDLNDTAKINLFRVIQESLTNVVRYAKAKTVEINAEVKNNEIFLSIKDDGIGFDQNTIAVKKTLGILGMKERITALGGRFSLESKPGEGTMINVSVPVHA